MLKGIFDKVIFGEFCRDMLIVLNFALKLNVQLESLILEKVYGMSSQQSCAGICYIIVK